MLEPVGGSGGPSPPPGGTTHLSGSQVQSQAQHILSVGSNAFWFDDYDARMRAFAQEMGTLDPSSAQSLLSQVMKDDPGAINSWLQGDRLLNDTSNANDRAAVVDAFASDYVSGHASDTVNVQQALDFISGGKGFTLTQGAQGIMDGGVQGLDNFLAAGSVTATDPLRQKIGEQLLQLAANDQTSAFNPSAAALAVHVMGGACDPGMSARAYGALSATDRSKVFDQLNTFGAVYERLGQGDALSQLVYSVDYESTFPLSKTAGGETYSQLGVDMIRQAKQDGALFPDMYNPETADPIRAAAFSSLYIDNQDAILGTMLNPRNADFDPTTPSSPSIAVGNDAAALANLFRATAMNGQNPLQQQMLGTLSGYIQGQQAAEKSNDPATEQTAVIRLGALAAITTDAVSQLQGSYNADAASRKALVSFLVDTALSAVPLGNLTKEGVNSVIGNIFGSQVAQDLAKNVSGSLIDKATGTLTDTAKNQLTQLLGPGGADVWDKSQISNDIHNMIFQGALQDKTYTDLLGMWTFYTQAIGWANQYGGGGSGN